jgi:hypothetical protein
MFRQGAAKSEVSHMQGVKLLVAMFTCTGSSWWILLALVITSTTAIIAR